MASRFPSSQSRTALLLLGHGSHVDGRSSDSVHRLARMLRESGLYAEVRVAFWKEEPQLRHAFLLVESPRVVAVPFFTSEGYFTDRVLPRELGVEPPVSEVDRVVGRGDGPLGTDEGPGSRHPVRVHYTRAVGAHPAMGDAVVERALERLAEGELLDRDGAPPSDVTLVVLGHGTERHPASGEIVEGITRRLARESSFQHVTCCFLDQDPRMLSVLESLDTPRAVLVPFFMAEGWHVGQTIPRDLDLDGGRSRVGGTEVLFTDPVGTHPAVVRVVEQMVAQAVEGTGAEPDREPDPDPLPARARGAFLDWIDRGGEEGRVFLQTRVSPWRGERAPEREGERERDGSGGVRPSEAEELRPSEDRRLYEIRHVDDQGQDPGDLERSRDPERARILADRTDEGAHRPLTTAPDLRRGWVLEGLDARQVWEAYAHLYPVAPVHWYLERREELPVISFRENAGRQTGIYRVVAELDDGEVRDTRRELCGAGCLRRVRWPVESGAGEPAPDRDDSSAKGEVPCPEPCSLFITMARERATGGEGQRRG